MTNPITKSFFIIFTIGLIIRLLLISVPGFKIDTEAWYAWAIRLNQLGFGQFYSSQVWTNYTPGYLYILSCLGFLKNILPLSDGLFFAVLKLPAILADLALGTLIYSLARKNLPKPYPLLLASLLLFNPGLVFNSTIWGQVDSLLTLVMVLSIICLKNHRLIISSVLIAIAVLIKPQALAIVPIFGLYLIKNLSLRKLGQLILPGLASLLLLSWPFFPNQPFGGLVNLIHAMTNDYAYNSLFAYNLWGTIGFWQSDSQHFLALSYQQIGLSLLALFWIITSWFYLNKNLGLFSISALACLAFYFLPTRVHERYLLPALVFLIFSFLESKSRLVLIAASILSFVYLLNLYYVYVYYNELYLKMPQILYQPTLYHLLDTGSSTLSLASTATFVITSWLIVKSYAPKTDST